MNLYRYFKGHEKAGRWKPYLVGSESERNAFINTTYGFCTVLGVASESDDPEELKGDCYYQGPFYIDIDFEGNLRKSISVANKIIAKLDKNGIPPELVDIWLSGKKGLHMTVPQSVFTPERPIMDLPHIYRALAKGLGIEDIDWSVYSQQKGRMWRLPSRQRADNGKYKVIISAEELKTLTVEQYEKFVTEPSRETDEPHINGYDFSKVRSVYSFAVVRATEERPTISTLVDDNMRNALGEARMPPCAIQLKEGQNVREVVGFNEKSVQMMKAVRAFIVGDEQKTILEEFAVKAKGDSYGTEAARLDHVHRSFRSVAGGSDYSWSCRSILSVLRVAPCEQCKLCFLRFQQDEAAEEEIVRKKAKRAMDEAADLVQQEEAKELATTVTALIESAGGIKGPPPTPPESGSGDGDDPPDPPKPRPSKPAEGPGLGEDRNKHRAPLGVDDSSENLTIHEHAYHFVSGKDGGLRRVTNFVIKITKVFIEHVPNMNEDRRVAVQAQVFMKGKMVGTINIEEDAWNSNASFTNAFNGIANCTFYGKDEDVRRMKSSLMKDIEKNTINIRRVHSYGIHYSKVAGADVFTYVEPGWSIDNFGKQDLYALSGKIAGAPRLQYVSPLPLTGDEETTQAFRELVAINQKNAIGLLLGWNMAAFLTAHIFARRNEFPLISLWGNAESGKTQTSGLFAALHGIHYLGATGENASPVSLGGSGASTFATWTSLSETLSAPKLIEEFNLRSLGKKYEEYAEHFKKVYNRHSVKRGTIRQSKIHGGGGAIDAHTVDIPLTAPTVLISEQSINIPSLVQRCIQIQLNEDMRRGPGMEQAFNALKRHYTHFDHFARTAYMETLMLSVEQVHGWITSWIDKIPTSIGDRPHYSYCVALAGLSFLLYLDEKYNLQINDIVNELIGVVVETTNMTSHEIAQKKTFSEADRMMNEFAVMAELSSKENGPAFMVKGQYYLREGNYLYLDGIAAHAQYMRFANSMQQVPIIPVYQSFRDLIRHTRYCETISAVKEGFARGRMVMKFNIAKMAERGIEVQCFVE